MKYEFALQRLPDWSLEEQAIIDKTIECVLHLPEYKAIECLANYIYDTTQVSYVTISKLLTTEPTQLATQVFLQHGKIMANITYLTAGTPCENVLSQNIFYYPSGVQEQFPEDIYLQQQNIASYLGITLNDAENNAIGTVVLLHESTIHKPGFISHLLTIIAPTLEEYLLSKAEEQNQ